MDLYKITEYPYNDVELKSLGWLEPQYLINTEYSECYIYGIENLEEFKMMMYYPSASNNLQSQIGKIVINSQEFTFSVEDIQLETGKMILISYENKKYLVFMGKLLSGKFYKYFIFNITNSKNIIFIHIDDSFIDLDFDKRFFGLYKDRLCFFLIKRKHDWNGEYIISPYVLENNSLIDLCDIIDYSYTSKFMNVLKINEIKFKQ